MLVHALRLRRKDVKLSADELRAATPMVGHLRYEAGPYQGRDGRGALTCLLMPASGATEPLIQLYRAKLKRIDARGMLLQGEEDEWRRKERLSYFQTLWCWVPPSLSMLDPSPAHQARITAEDLADAINGR